MSQAFQHPHVSGPIPQEVSRELAGGERLVWTGQPVRGVRLRKSDAFLIPFSILWGGFAIFWEAMAFNSGAPFFFRLWGVPFVLVGLYLMAGRFFYEAWLRARTYYAVTSERVLIVKGGLGRTVTSLRLKTIADLSLQEAGSGVGTISFGGGTTWGSMFGAGAGWPGAERHLGHRFDLLANARSVYESIRAAQRVAP